MADNRLPPECVPQHQAAPSRDDECACSSPTAEPATGGRAAGRADVRKYTEENRVRFSYGRRLPTPREHIRRRPRTPDSYATLSAMVRNRWQSWLKQGRIEILGPRHYRTHLSAPREEAPPADT